MANDLTPISYLKVNATGESFGTSRVQAQLTSVIDALSSYVKSYNDQQPDSTLRLGIIPQCLPTLSWRASEFADQGYAVQDVNPLTGEQRYANLRFDDNGRAFGIPATEMTPELRALLTLPGLPDYPQLNAYMFNIARERGALAPLWEVQTAKLQGLAGDPNAGLSEQERAAKAGLAATADTEYANSHPNDANAQAKRVGGFSPIGIDLDRDGKVSTLSMAASHVSFDWDSTGYRKNVGWVAGNDGFLVLDGHIASAAANDEVWALAA